MNGTCKDDSPLGLLMQDFACTNPDDMNYRILAERTRYFKEDEEGVYIMSKVIEEMINEEKRDAVLRFVKLGKLSIDEIAECIQLPLVEVKKLAEQIVH